MPVDKIFVIISGIVGIIFTYWFFLKKNEVAVEATDEIKILVDGGYQPSAIKIPIHKKTTLTFFRKDPSSCLEEVVLSDFKIRQFLPLEKQVAIDITPAKTGEFVFSCGMNMFHGKLIVS